MPGRTCIGAGEKTGRLKRGETKGAASPDDLVTVVETAQ